MMALTAKSVTVPLDTEGRLARASRASQISPCLDAMKEDN